MDGHVEAGHRSAHITVCICTYRRPALLRRLLNELSTQTTNGSFTFSIVVVDNDRLRSAEPVVGEFAAWSAIPVGYCVEPEQSIPRARNTAVAHAHGDLIAFIDDDEFPSQRWLLTLLEAYQRYGVDGVLGPVKPHFDEEPPAWLVKGKFYERTTYPTGLVIDGRKGRTGNVLLNARLFAGDPEPFKPHYRIGEDQDFFGRMIDRGHVFIWCDDAVAHEVIPPARWKRSFLLQRALFRGAFSPFDPAFGPLDVAKSVVAVATYSVLLPFSLLVGQHRFMTYLFKIAYHVGQILGRRIVPRLSHTGV